MSHRAVPTVLTLVFTLVLATPSSAVEFGSEDWCPHAVRISFADRSDLQRLASLVEPWEVDHEAGVLITDVDAPTLARLRAAGFTVEIDAALTERLCRPRVRLKDQLGGIPGFPCYRTVEETFASAEALAAIRPDLASWIDIGDSWEKVNGDEGEGYDLMVLKLTNSAVEGTGTPEAPLAKPVLFAMGSIHAREYTPPELLIRFAEHLVHGHGSDADATWILDEHEVHLLFMANPDGRKRAEGGLLWRKNANNDYCTGSNTRGADLNRNFSYEWGCCDGSSTDPCDLLYRGPQPASEPETQAVQSYLRTIFPDQWNPEPPADATGIFIDVHSYSELVLWAWGYGQDDHPNLRAQETLGRKLAFFNSYLPQQGIFFYPTDGTTVDFAYGELGVAAYTFELGTWFFQACGYFNDQILDDNLAALIYAAKGARSPYLTPAGPDVYDINLEADGPLAAGDLVRLTATVSDGNFSFQGGAEPFQAVDAVEVGIDAPPWRSPAPTPLPLLPADGAFDSSWETVEVMLDTHDLDPGRHTLFFRARDADGNWGAVSAIFLDLGRPRQSPRRPGGRVRP